MAQHSPHDEAFLTTAEVLEYLQVNLRTVYRLIKAGELPAIRVGRQWRFRKRDIDEWLESRRAGAPPAGEKAASAATPARPQSRVLVVDDEPSIREMLSQTLALADYQVDTATNAAAALARLRTSDRPYDLLIADLRMPGMDGLALIRQVKQIRATLPIIIITGFSSESTAIAAANLGVAGYLTKPFRVPQVLAAAARAVGGPAD